jgi:hypothetical protein
MACLSDSAQRPGRTTDLNSPSSSTIQSSSIEHHLPAQWYQQPCGLLSTTHVDSDPLTVGCPCMQQGLQHHPGLCHLMHVPTQCPQSMKASCWLSAKHGHAPQPSSLLTSAAEAASARHSKGLRGCCTGTATPFPFQNLDLVLPHHASAVPAAALQDCHHTVAIGCTSSP